MTSANTNALISARKHCLLFCKHGDSLVGRRSAQLVHYVHKLHSCTFSWVISFPTCNRINQETNDNCVAWEYRYTYQPPLSTICQHFWRPWKRQFLTLGLFPFKFCSAEVKFWRWWQKRFGQISNKDNTSCSCVTVLMDPATYARTSPSFLIPKMMQSLLDISCLDEKWLIKIKSHRNLANPTASPLYSNVQVNLDWLVVSIVFWFSPLLGEDFQFDEHIFWNGWFNLQPVEGFRDDRTDMTHEKLWILVTQVLPQNLHPGVGDTPVTESESVSESSGREETERRVDQVDSEIFWSGKMIVLWTFQGMF